MVKPTKGFFLKFLGCVIVGVFCFWAASADFALAACAYHNVSGYAWSENVGYISFSCENTGSAVNYGVDVDADGNFSGYAWAGGGRENDGTPVATIGWISFESSAVCPSPPCEAKLDTTTTPETVSGWARACTVCPTGCDCTSAAALSYAGWDGWIKLGDTAIDFGVELDDNPLYANEFIKWGWSDIDTGWISFNSANCDTDRDGNSDGSGWTATCTAGAPSPRTVPGDVWTGNTGNPATSNKMITWGGFGDAGNLSDGKIFDPFGVCADGSGKGSWSPMSNIGANACGIGTKLWTGDTGNSGTSYRMIVFGGYCGTWRQDGAIYNPASDTWTTPPCLGSPPSCISSYNINYHSAVWAGPPINKAFIFRPGPIGSSGTCGRGNLYSYDPASDTLVLLTGSSTPNSPECNYDHSSVWAPEIQRMIVWGGRPWTSGTTTGGIYNPTNNSWTKTTDNPMGERLNHTVVWTGNTGNPATSNRMIIWGGGKDTTTYNSGGIWRPNGVDGCGLAGGCWGPMADAPISGRYGHTAVWTGTGNGNNGWNNKMIVWGGLNGSTKFDDGAIYDPASDTWQLLPPAGAPSGRYAHAGVWSPGSISGKLIIWGGNDIFPNPWETDTGGIYTFAPCPSGHIADYKVTITLPPKITATANPVTICTGLIGSDCPSSNSTPDSTPQNFPLSISWNIITGSQNGYQIQVDNDSGFSSPEINETVDNNSGSRNTIVYPSFSGGGTYYWQVKIWDSEGTESNLVGGSFLSPVHPYPCANFDFSPTNPGIGTVNFTDKSECYWWDGTEITSGDCTSTSLPYNALYTWNFGDGSPPDHTKGDISHPYTSIGKFKATLSVQDDLSTCLIQKPVPVRLLPKWKEVLPQ